MVDFSQVFHKPAKKAVRCCEKFLTTTDYGATKCLIIKTLYICQNLLASPHGRSFFREVFYVCWIC